MNCRAQTITQRKRKSQLDKAVLGLRTLILKGEVAPGNRLSEVAVAERMGLSRTPIRQAMDRLVSEGLLERIATGGCRVAQITEDVVSDAIELRGVLEGTAARLAAERGADPVLFAEAEAVLDQIDYAITPLEAFDFDLYVSENAKFHLLLTQLSNSKLMQRELERVNQLPLASPSAFLSEQERIPVFLASLNQAQQQHRAILDAIKNREGARAEALAREHARLARVNFEYTRKRFHEGTGSQQGLSLSTLVGT